MPTRLGRPTAADAALTRRRIIEAARSRFARDGYRATTNRAIADDVGITPTALYHYVDSKATLYALVYCDTIDQVYTAFEQAVREHDHLIGACQAVLGCSRDLMKTDPTIAGFITAISDETRRHPDLLARLGHQRGRHARFFRQLAQRAADRGEIADADVAAVADLLGAVLTGLARATASEGDLARYSAAVDAFGQLFCSASADS